MLPCGILKPLKFELRWKDTGSLIWCSFTSGKPGATRFSERFNLTTALARFAVIPNLLQRAKLVRKGEV